MLRGMLRGSGGEKQVASCDSRQLHGYIYCAANEVRKLADTALTACDADRLRTILANLQELARSLNSPQLDQQDIEAWHDTLSARVAEMRTSQLRDERAPDLRNVEVFISTGLIPNQRRHRATA